MYGMNEPYKAVRPAVGILVLARESPGEASPSGSRAAKVAASSCFQLYQFALRLTLPSLLCKFDNSLMAWRFQEGVFAVAKAFGVMPLMAW
jgi:hypothetical protein